MHHSISYSNNKKGQKYINFYIYRDNEIKKWFELPLDNDIKLDDIIIGLSNSSTILSENYLKIEKIHYGYNTYNVDMIQIMSNNLPYSSMC